MTTLEGAKLDDQDNKSIQIRICFYDVPRACNTFNQDNRSWACNHSKACPMYKNAFHLKDWVYLPTGRLEMANEHNPRCFPPCVATRTMLAGYIKIRMVAFCTRFTFCPQLRWCGMQKVICVVVLVATGLLFLWERCASAWCHKLL